MAAPVDILGMGAVAVDDLLFLSEFPRPDSKGPILRKERHAGGLAGTALVAARRMGRDCDYAGTLGDDELSRFVISRFEAEGVSLRHLVRRPGARPFHSTILVDTATKTRTILFDEQDVIGPDPAAAGRGSDPLRARSAGRPRGTPGDDPGSQDSPGGAHPGCGGPGAQRRCAVCGAPCPGRSPHPSVRFCRKDHRRDRRPVDCPRALEGGPHRRGHHAQRGRVVVPDRGGARRGLPSARLPRAGSGHERMR